MNSPNNVSPVDVEAMVVEGDDGGPVVIEPIGWFIKCIQGLVATADKVVDDDESADTQDLEKLKVKQPLCYSISMLGFLKL